MLQEAEERAVAAIDPGGDYSFTGTPPTHQHVDDEGGGHTSANEVEGDAPSANALEPGEEISERMWSLQVSGDVPQDEEEGEEPRPAGVAVSVDSDAVAMEADGEDGV